MRRGRRSGVGDLDRFDVVAAMRFVPVKIIMIIIDHLNYFPHFGFLTGFQFGFAGVGEGS